MKDDDKLYDEFSPGVTEEQIRKAEELLGGMELPTFIEKRDLSADYHTGVLQSIDARGKSYEIKVAMSPLPGEKRHVLLSREPLPPMDSARIVIRRFDRMKVVDGWVEQSHEGRRSEDRLNSDRLQVAFFYPRD